MTRTTLRQGALFLVIGGLSALVDAGVFWVLTWLGVVAWLASAVSFMSAFAVNYNGNRRIVFRAAHSAGALWRYCALVLVNLGISAGGVALIVSWGVHPMVAKIITMAIVAVVSFIAMRLWVFGRSGGRRAVEPDPT